MIPYVAAHWIRRLCSLLLFALGSQLGGGVALAASTTTVNKWSVSGPCCTGYTDGGVTLFEVTEVFTPAADLGGSDNRYAYSIRNLTTDLTASIFAVANPDNHPYITTSPAGWTSRVGTQSVVWDAGSGAVEIAPGATLGGFVFLTPGLIPELTIAEGFAVNERGWIMTRDPLGVRIDVFGDLSHLGTTSVVPVTMPVVLLPGEDFVAESTSFKASHNTSAPLIQRSSIVSLLAGSGSRVASRFQRGRGAAVPRQSQVPAGAAAGEDETSWRAWSDISVRQLEDQLSSTAYKSDIEQIVIGADTFASEKLLLGALVSYERHDVETRFNRGSQDIDQYQLAGYAGYLFNSSVSIDAAFGYASLNIDQDRLQPLSGRVKSKVDSSRWFGAANVNGFLEAGAFLVDVSTGILYAKDKTDDFIESNGLHNSVPAVRLGIWRAGASVTYPTGPFEIFGNAFFVYDFKRTPIVVGALQEQPDDDRTEFQFAVGARYTVSDRLSAALEYSTVRGKANFKSDTLSANISIEF